MRIALLGYGKMGQEIEAILTERGHEITHRVSTQHPVNADDLRGTDVAIEFSRPEAAVDNMFMCFEADVPVVVGTTGWYGRLPEVRSEAARRNSGLLYATNFSIGVQIMFHLNRELAKIMDKMDEYEPGIMEIHHAAKLDSPSGTAITLAEDILHQIKRKTSWVNELAENPSELSIISQREGEVPGTHMVTWNSRNDNVSLIHEARSRRGFALGAVKAAEWLHGKRGVYTMHDFLKF
jgi:4-hydroxy-tetrahydrodipicolinate reductase